MRYYPDIKRVMESYLHFSLDMFRGFYQAEISKGYINLKISVN